MANVQLTNGREFSADPSKSLLDAALSAGLAWSYSCKTGRCNTCKSKVIQGETRALHDEVGLTDAEKKDNWVLTCVRAATTDLVLEVENLSDVALPLVKIVPSRISQLERLAPDVLCVRLRLPPTADFKFLAGQYIDVVGAQGVRRSYSLASADFENKTLELHIRAVDGGVMSDYWFHRAQVNDLLRLNGPMGTFFLRDISNMDVFFLATGTGIAPVKAMMESMVQLPKAQCPNSITVLWGGRTENDLYMDIQQIPIPHRFVPVLSKPSADWSGARGHVQDVLLSIQPDVSGAVVYACGSNAMIQSAHKALTAAGLRSQNFHSDAFVCSANT